MSRATVPSPEDRAVGCGEGPCLGAPEPGTQRPPRWLNFRLPPGHLRNRVPRGVLRRVAPDRAERHGGPLLALDVFEDPLLGLIESAAVLLGSRFFAIDASCGLEIELARDFLNI